MAPLPNPTYHAFVDPSGGSADSFTLAVSHRDGERFIIDAIREIRPPFSPEAVIDDLATLLKSYRIARVVGDRYAGEFPRELFRKRGIHYVCADKTKSDLFRDLLPMLNSGSIVLPKSDRLINQLTGLERRTARSGKDSIDHGPGGHDDLANAVAGAADCIIAAERHAFDVLGRQLPPCSNFLRRGFLRASYRAEHYQCDGTHQGFHVADTRRPQAARPAPNRTAEAFRFNRGGRRCLRHTGRDHGYVAAVRSFLPIHFRPDRAGYPSDRPHSFLVRLGWLDKVA
jgi:hypothetical protein